MASRDERAFRLLYSAIAGSTLTVKEIRRLVEDLSMHGELVRTLQESLWQLCDELEIKFGRSSKSGSNFESSGEFLTDLIVQKVMSRKISKHHLRQMMGEVNSGMNELVNPSENTLRGMIEAFVELAGSERVSELMHQLELDVEQDPFLGGIDRKSRGFR